MVLKKPNFLCLKVLGIKKYWQFPIFAVKLLSALKCLTSVFEMGTGEPLCYFHQYNNYFIFLSFSENKIMWLTSNHLIDI